MSKFDLEKFKSGTPAYTRNGRKATFIGICEECGQSNRLVVHIKDKNGITSMHLSGRYLSEHETTFDLVRMATPYDHLKPGDLVMVWPRHKDPSEAKVRKFYGVDERGRPQFVSNTGRTLTGDNIMSLYDYVKEYLND